MILIGVMFSLVPDPGGRKDLDPLDHDPQRCLRLNICTYREEPYAANLYSPILIIWTMAGLSTIQYLKYVMSFLPPML